MEQAEITETVDESKMHNITSKVEQLELAEKRLAQELEELQGEYDILNLTNRDKIGM